MTLRRLSAHVSDVSEFSIGDSELGTNLTMMLGDSAMWDDFNETQIESPPGTQSGDHPDNPEIGQSGGHAEMGTQSGDPPHMTPRHRPPTHDPEMGAQIGPERRHRHA